MKKVKLLAIALLTCSTVIAETHARSGDGRVALMDGLGELHHPVTTDRSRAQLFFDQGLKLIYGFNHDEAERSFRRAAELDPNMAMAYWGIALAMGPNYNLPVDAEREKIAFENIQKAKALASKASANERGYVEALAKRYTDAPNPDYQQLAAAYKDAMREFSRKFPDDPDAATLYAESIMNLRPWALWERDGAPAEGTEEIVSVLESVLRRYPVHIGAMHFYIHAVEASPHPEHALSVANKLASLAPAAGHLVHIPSHIYMRTGFYNAAMRANVTAAMADEEYIEFTGATGVYPMMYYSHNLHFVAVSAGMEGQYARAKMAADALVEHVSPHLKEMPMLESFMVVPLTVDLRFERWNEILKRPQPNPNLKIAIPAMWHYARGVALAATGKTQQAEAERQIFEDFAAGTPEDAIWAPPFNNKTKNILKIAANVLQARIAVANRDYPNAIRLYQDAVGLQDGLNYGEPPDWYFPVREALGGALLESGDFVAAEKVFRADLECNPRNGRSLFGLARSLAGQGRNYDADLVRQQFEVAWKNADSPLEVEQVASGR
ncbi:MAG: tetratricopeptide repeat protein [Candidatus Acidiferrales bacterium]